MRNPQKGEPLFSLDQRQELIEDSLAAPRQRAMSRCSRRLVVDLAREVGAHFIVKGLRAVSDFESELQMAQMNRSISGVDTLFIPSASRNSFLASKLIREVARFGGEVTTMVPAPVANRLTERFTDSCDRCGPTVAHTGARRGQSDGHQHDDATGSQAPSPSQREVCCMHDIGRGPVPPQPSRRQR